jgi:hypothetical protein
MPAIREIDALSQTISELRAELAASAAAFDKYRQRARSSLTKASNEQVAAEKKLKETLDLLKVR